MQRTPRSPARRANLLVRKGIPMLRHHWIFSVTLLCVIATLIVPVQAADEAQQKEDQGKQYLVLLKDAVAKP